MGNLAVPITHTVTPPGTTVIGRHIHFRPMVGRLNRAAEPLKALRRYADEAERLGFFA